VKRTTEKEKLRDLVEIYRIHDMLLEVCEVCEPAIPKITPHLRLQAIAALNEAWSLADVLCWVLGHDSRFGEAIARFEELGRVMGVGEARPAKKEVVH
jgi:hypothetical protein